MTLSPDERDEDTDATDLWCPGCEEMNTVHRPEQPEGKWTGRWGCINCGWSGYPMDLHREPPA